MFNSTDHQNIESLITFIGKDRVVTAGKVLHVQCKTDVGLSKRKIQMIL